VPRRNLRAGLPHRTLRYGRRVSRAYRSRRVTWINQIAKDPKEPSSCARHRLCGSEPTALDKTASVHGLLLGFLRNNPVSRWGVMINAPRPRPALRERAMALPTPGLHRRGVGIRARGRATVVSSPAR
jgi:hypothetical protein